MLPAMGFALVIVSWATNSVPAQEKSEPESRPLLSELTGGEHGVQEIVFALRQPGKDPHWYANFGYYADSDTRLTYGNGGKLCRLNLATGTVTTLLEDKEGAVRDPVVHYDAEQILFSYRKGGTALAPSLRNQSSTAAICGN